MGVGDSWGTKEEFLHPRDKNGRFRNSWKMAAGVIEKIVATLSAFNPKTFTSDEEAATWVRGQSRSNRFLTNRGPSIDRFLRDYTKINADVRAGKPNADAANIKKGMSPLPEDLILSRVMGPEAFGLDPANVGQIEELTGKLVKDKGFSSTNIGTPVPHQPGAITMSIVAPKGTQALLPSTTRPTREVILDTDQPLRITKVDPDGQGGFYVYAVAVGHSDGEKSLEINKTVPQEGDVPGGGVPGDQGTGGGTAVPEVPGGSGQATGGVGQRNEGHVGIVGQGPGAGGTEQGTGGVIPEVPVKPEEGPDTRSTFRDAFDQADIKVPTVGQRRKQFMDAYNGVASGKKTPQEAVNDLDNAISVNKKIIESDKIDGTDSGPLVEDVKRQQALSDLIKEHFNFTGRKTQKAPEEKKQTAIKAVKKAPVPEKKLGVAGGKPVKTEQIRKATGGMKKTPLSDELNGAYTRTNLAQLREIADKNGIKVPGDKKTKRDVFEHIVSELKRKESGAPEVPEVKKSAVAKKTAVKKAVPEKRAIKKVPTPPEKKAVPEKKTAPEAPGDVDKMTVAQLRSEAKRQDKKIPSSITRKADIVEFLKGTDNEKQSKAIRESASKPSSAEVKARLDKVTSREDADKYLRDLNLTAAEQKQLAKDLNISVPARANKEEVHKTLVHWGAGRRIDSERISKAGETGRGFDKAAKKAAGEEVKAPEVPETSKPRWGTLKTHGFKDGDVVMYHGQDRRKGPSAKGEKVRIQFDPSGFTLRDPETGKVVHAGGFAHRAWFSRVPDEKKAPEVKTPEVKVPEKKVGPSAAELKVQQQEKRRQEVEARRLERQKVAAEKKAATEKAAADKVAERQRIAQEKVQAREKAVAERKAERERVAAEKKAAAEKAIADRKAEREQAAAEKKRQAEIAKQAQKKQVAETEHEVKVRQKMEDLRRYIGATDKMSMADIRTWADRNKVKIPPELKTKEQIREHVLRAIAEKEVAHDVERARVPALLRELRKEGIPFLERYKYRSSSAIEEYAAKVRKVAVDQGIDPKRFKPQGRLTQPQSLAMNGTLSEADLDKILPHNTDPNHPVRISGWRGSEGYEVQHGVAVRRNGITYILETTAEDADNPYHVAMLTEGFDRFHHEIPERSSYQHHYNWYLGTNPADEFWQRQYNNPNHVSLASAGNGRVNIWKQGKGGGVGNGLKTPFDYHETLNHEFGHNVDRGHSKSASPEWHDVGRNDWRANVSRWEKNRLVAVPLADVHPLTPKREETRAYPNGISDYGKSSPAEDFAESLAYYFLDTRIAYNQDTGEPFFFEDLFPDRTAYLDSLFPRRARERAALRAAERERLRQLRG